LSSLQGVIGTYNIITSGIYNAAIYFVEFYIEFYLSFTLDFTLDFIWSFYIAATVRVKAVQELQQQKLKIENPGVVDVKEISLTGTLNIQLPQTETTYQVQFEWLALV